jgi:signal peptide peptidase SppA
MEIARESVFVSALRSFCKVFFSIIALFIALFITMTVYSMFSSPYEMEVKTSIEVLPNLNNSLDVMPLNSPVILRLDVHGVIGALTLTSQKVEDILIDSRRGVLGHDRVKAILLHLDTPGGGATDSDNIYRMLKAYKEAYKVPVFAYVDGMCASGGMYISSAADKTYASPPSIIGSVGVRSGPFFNVSDAMGRYGIQSKTLTQGLDKDMMNPFRPWTADEGSDIMSTMAFLYQRFVNLVTASHPRLDREKLIGEYGAKIFVGPEAEKLGYIDVADAEYKTALADLMHQANLDPQKPYQVVHLKPKIDFITALSNNSQSIFGKLFENWFPVKGTPNFHDQFAYLYEAGVTQ